MVVYSIKDLENLSGVKAHTIRIWEKRYDIVTPSRTKTNVRFYTDEDLKRLLNVCFLYRKGYKISKIASMPKAQLKEKVASHSNLNLNFEDKIDSLLLSIMDLDGYGFTRLLDRHISQVGLQETMSSIIYPLLDKLSIAWLAGGFTAVHESYVTQIIRSKIIWCIEELEHDSTYTPSYMLFLPPGDQQELSILFLQYLLKKNKCGVINLGRVLNMEDIKLAAGKTKPDYVFTFLNDDRITSSIQNYINQLSTSVGESQLLITGNAVHISRIAWPENVKTISDLDEAIAFIQNK